MGGFTFTETGIEGLALITPFSAEDPRGVFYKYFNYDVYAKNGIYFTPKEEFSSASTKNTLRGIHFQLEHSQDKLVRVTKGAIIDAAVDLRPDSPTFGKWRAFNLDVQNALLLYIPKFFGHAFLALEDETVVHYLCGDVYDQASEGSLLWNDPQINIDWPLAHGEEPILSDRDKNAMSFAEYCARLGIAKE